MFVETMVFEEIEVMMVMGLMMVVVKVVVVMMEVMMEVMMVVMVVMGMASVVDGR